MGLEADVVGLGGIARTRELIVLGHAPHSLTDAVRSGRLQRLRKGYYALPELPESAAAAERVGGTLAGVSALEARGVWVPNRPHPLVVAVPPNAHHLRSPTNARRALGVREVELHWDAEVVPRFPPYTEPVAQALRRIARQLRVAELFAAFESALHQRLLTMAEQRELRRAFLRRSPKFEHASSLSGSGGESLVKFELLDLPIRFRQQVAVEDTGRVDFVLGRRQILEVDGRRFHSGSEEFERDRRRYAMASLHGFRTLRFSTLMVEREMPLVIAAIRAAVARGDLD